MDPKGPAARTGDLASVVGRRLADAILAVALIQLGFPVDTPLSSYRDYVRETWRVPRFRAPRRILGRTRRHDDEPDHRS
jgi:hypothetical protein